jgi:hypothetical protein
MYIVSQERERKRHNIRRIFFQIPAIWQRTQEAGGNADDVSILLAAGDS